VDEESQPGSYHISTWQEAELNAARWMRSWGYADAVTDPGAAIDVQATGAVGQVEFQAAAVDRPALQLLVAARKRNASDALLCFSGSGYTQAAVEYAGDLGIALFTYDIDGAMQPVNRPAVSVTTGPAPPPTSDGARPTLDSARFGMLVGVVGLVVMMGLTAWVLVMSGNLTGVVIAISFVVALAVVVNVRR
jgi:hypothetical protein